MMAEIILLHTYLKLIAVTYDGNSPTNLCTIWLHIITYSHMVVYGFLDFKLIMVMIHNIWYVYEFSFASAHARETYLNIDGLS